MKLRSVLVLMVMALLVVPLAACGGGDGSTGTTAVGTDTTTAASSPVGEQTVAIASKTLMDAIAASLEKNAVVRPLTAWVVSSATVPNVYFVAMEFSSSMENHLGLWATDDPEGGTGAIWAINDVAKDATTWPDGDDANPKLSEDDAGAKAALAKYNVQ